MHILIIEDEEQLCRCTQYNEGTKEEDRKSTRLNSSHIL